MKRLLPLLFIGLGLLLMSCENAQEPFNPDAGQTPALAKSAKGTIRINILLKSEITDAELQQIDQFGAITGTIPEINAVFLRGAASVIGQIQALDFVAAAGPDQERMAPPFSAVEVTNFADGMNTWDLDAVNVTTGPGFDNRVVTQDGTGVYVGILDTGLLPTWRQYFPQERIADEYAKSFMGSPVQSTNISEQPNKWEHDTNSHGTHVTSTILGYSLGSTPINGVAPNATIIPVKVLNQNGRGWSSVIAYGIMYMAQLKDGPLSGSPVVVNMSLGGSRLDPVEKAAINYAIAQGVIIVAAAGNEGEKGMDYPGAYAPVISVAASGWIGEWTSNVWWYDTDVPDPTDPADFYITEFSGRALPGQDLDVAAPGSWVLGPYQTQMGQTSYYFLGGTSQATPHVAGIVALMAQKDPGLDAANAESILESSAIELPPGSRNIMTPAGPTTVTWEADATGSGLTTADAALAATP